MDAVGLFLAQHAKLHGAEVGPAEGGSYEELVLRGLDAEQIRLRPRPGLNSLAWLLWHMARAEDAALNAIVAGEAQVIDRDAWPRRLGVARRDIGTGMSDEEVAALSREVDVAALRDYRVAVGRRTRALVAGLPAEAWAAPVTEADLDRAAADGAFGPNAGWVPRVFRGRTKGGLLASIAILHNAMHLGEAVTVRAEAGFGAGR